MPANLLETQRLAIQTVSFRVPCSIAVRARTIPARARIPVRSACALRSDASSDTVTFFIAGLHYLLRFERVHNLGAYSIPSETRLLIPSGCNGNLSVPKACRFSPSSVRRR
jgi:hypothetical protein